MYVPRHYHWSFTMVPILVGFYISNKYPSWDVTIFVQFPLAYIAGAWAYYLAHAGLMYQRYMTGDNEQNEQGRVTVIKNVSPLINGRMPVYEQAIVQPVLWKERYVAFTLLRSYQNGFEPDLRETKWLGGEIFKNGERHEFVAIKSKWEQAGLLARKSPRKNATHIVANFDLLKLVANGHELPPPRPGMTSH